MNESRQQLDLNLINKLLTCNEGEEPEILRENADLIDAELVLMMERVVSVLEERDAGQQAAWLQELASRLGGRLEMPSVDGREERGVYGEVRSLERRFGKGHLYFADRAAFPLALTPHLCYQIWANFQRDVGGKLLNIPWIAVADLLLSGLCHPVGHELYEIDLAVRNLLLKELENNFNFREIRIEELSTFMLEYVKGKINSEDEDIRDFATVQKWTALAYVKPGEAAIELALTLREKVLFGNKAELVRFSSVLDNLAEPLRGKYEPLLVYSRGMGRLARDDDEGAKGEFKRLAGDGLRVSGVRLSIPGQVAVGDGDVFDVLARRFGWRRDNLDLIQLLLNCSAGEEGEILRRHQHLVDSVLVEMMWRIGVSLVDEGEENAAEFLVDLAEKLAEALAKYQEKQDASNDYAIAALVELIRTSQSEDTIWRAIRSLGKIGQRNDIAIAVLADLIGISQSKDTCLRAIWSLGEIGQGNDSAIAALVELIGNYPSQHIRRLAARSLEKIGQGNDTAIAALVKLIEVPYQSKNIHRQAVKSLGEIGQGNDTAIAALIELIGNYPPKDICTQAIRSLGKIGKGNETAIAALVELVSKTQSENTRKRAAESLGKIAPGNEKAIAALEELLANSSNEETRRVTEQALKQIAV